MGRRTRLAWALRPGDFDTLFAVVCVLRERDGQVGELGLRARHLRVERRTPARGGDGYEENRERVRVRGSESGYDERVLGILWQTPRGVP